MDPAGPVVFGWGEILPIAGCLRPDGSRRTVPLYSRKEVERTINNYLDSGGVVFNRLTKGIFVRQWDAGDKQFPVIFRQLIDRIGN